ncbi:MAG: hypothetical protein BSOLF_0873 [Candidatus Carbobacillus altaicus]|uniref:Uncharacterized protein n=1 Tax=Candidatus Carbonibacillus altaicus TaxID=2163959 RepID=A0A2R6Y4U0_9BACL|nr:MAG: hypothetical protein BSOLF_0873 [Candidatus Carbobacillus altaicus]
MFLFKTAQRFIVEDTYLKKGFFDRFISFLFIISFIIPEYLNITRSGTSFALSYI